MRVRELGSARALGLRAVLRGHRAIARRTGGSRAILLVTPGTLVPLAHARVHLAHAPVSGGPALMRLCAGSPHAGAPGAGFTRLGIG